MKTLTLLSVLFPVVGSMLLACGAADDAGAGSPGGASSTAASTPANVPDALPAACTAYFDGLAARKTRCASEPNALVVDAFEGARESAVARCLQQGANPGTGYTPAFYGKCREALDAAACGDVDTIVKACWEPRGTLVRGMGCATDDQCADGYCKLQEGAAAGSTCGKCDVPVWGTSSTKCLDDGEPVSNVKCKAGLVCQRDYGGPTGSCQSRTWRYGTTRGQSCGGTSTGTCEDGFGCIGLKCVELPIARAGESCDEKHCEPGSLCRAPSEGVPGKESVRVCKKVAGLGEACHPSGYAEHEVPCVSWLECSPTQRCELPEILKCN